MKTIKLNVLTKLPIPMYSPDFKHLKKYIIKSKAKLISYIKNKDENGCSALVLSAEWYMQNKSYVLELINQKLTDWKLCEIYRDLLDVQIVVVLALKSNRKSSSRINKRVVERAYNDSNIPVCSYTREELLRENASAEHIIPLSTGGNNSVWNICVADNSLNNNRGNANFWKYWRRIISDSL